VAAESHFRRSDRQDGGSIEIQGIHRGPASGSSANQSQTLPGEMVLPALLPRIEDPDRPACFGIYSQFASAFPQGAGDAGQCEVIGNRRTTRRHWNDMVNVEAGFLPILGKVAVLALVAGPTDGQPAERLGNSRIQAPRAS
jgi:hypothetical protein